MEIDNNIPIVYCSEYLKKALKNKGCNFIIEGTVKPKNSYELSIVLDWVLINFETHIWATYNDEMKQWVGNYHKLGIPSNWVSGFSTKDEAIEAALEIVVDYII